LIIDHNMNIVYSTTGFSESVIRDIIITELDSLPDWIINPRPIVGFFVSRHLGLVERTFTIIYNNSCL
jgi:hypothetical protein